MNQVQPRLTESEAEVIISLLDNFIGQARKLDLINDDNVKTYRPAISAVHKMYSALQEARA